MAQAGRASKVPLKIRTASPQGPFRGERAGQAAAFDGIYEAQVIDTYNSQAQGRLRLQIARNEVSVIGGDGEAAGYFSTARGTVDAGGGIRGAFRFACRCDLAGAPFTFTGSVVVRGASATLEGRFTLDRGTPRYWYTISAPRVSGGPPPTTTTPTTTTPTVTTPTVTRPTATTPTVTTPEKPKVATRTANTAQLPLDNGQPACRSARDRISLLNQELVKAVNNWNFTAGREGASSTQLEMIGTRIGRLEADLKGAVRAGTGVCTAQAVLARPASPNSTATVTRASGQRQPLGEGLALRAGDTVSTGGSSESLTFEDEPDSDLLASGVLKSTLLQLPEDRFAVIHMIGGELLIGERSRGKPFLQRLGEVYYKVKKRLSQPFEVRVPACNCTVRVLGTAFTLTVKGQAARIRAYDGTVAVISNKQTVLVKKGFEIIIGSGKPSAAPTRFKAPANPFWETPVGLWQVADYYTRPDRTLRYTARIVAINGGYEEIFMGPNLYLSGGSGCLLRAGEATARYFPKGTNFYRETTRVWWPPKGASRSELEKHDNCTPVWTSIYGSAELVVRGDTMTKRLCNAKNVCPPLTNGLPAPVEYRYTRTAG